MLIYLSELLPGLHMVHDKIVNDIQEQQNWIRTVPSIVPTRILYRRSRRPHFVSTPPFIRLLVDTVQHRICLQECQLLHGFVNVLETASIASTVRIQARKLGSMIGYFKYDSSDSIITTEACLSPHRQGGHPRVHLPVNAPPW